MNSQQTATVKVKSGVLEGMYRDGLHVFKGIPYAAPPVGELRWMPPQPVKPWEGVRPAREYGAMAPQPEMVPPPGMEAQEDEVQDEDCLFLNVFTPGLDDRKRPVMVWIHGGAFNLGSGSSPMYEASKLARNGDAVIVTLNYRLGELGFLRLKEVTGGIIPSSGNEGLLDQIAALLWVKENIAVFGGDPGNVTVFGESAGAMSIGCLLAMPAAKGTFHKAIMESGVGSTAVAREAAVETAKRFLKVLGIDGNDTDALRKLTPEQILEADTELRKPAIEGEAEKLTAMTPVIDGEIIPDVTNEMAKKGFSREIPTIVGTNLDEYRLFSMMEPPGFTVDDTELKRRLSAFLTDEEITQIVGTYRAFLERRGEPAGNMDIWAAIQTDMMFRMPALEFVESQTKNGQKSYNYLFTWTNPAGGPLGACHALELGFLFEAYEPMFCGTGPDADKLSACMQDAWISFARTGNPGGKIIGEWPPYGEKRLTMLLEKNCHVEAAPYEDARSAWDNVKTKKSPMP
ncbi:MAG: carboxylesterase/lipase family protein [Dehalococcoidales bacterium]|nr:carboxylesterase/lipase family protein [Dehalococcoidales bacterium]